MPAGFMSAGISSSSKALPSELDEASQNVSTPGDCDVDPHLASIVEIEEGSTRRGIEHTLVDHLWRNPSLLQSEGQQIQNFSRVSLILQEYSIYASVECQVDEPVQFTTGKAQGISNLSSIVLSTKATASLDARYERLMYTSPVRQFIARQVQTSSVMAHHRAECF
jgi:hypothetical protein